MSLYEIEVPTLNGTSTLEAYKGKYYSSSIPLVDVD